MKTKYERNSYFDKSFISKSEDKTSSCSGVEVKKGDHFGEFNLGSTIVLLFEAPQNFQLNVEPGQPLRYGQAIGHSAQDITSHSE